MSIRPGQEWGSPTAEPPDLDVTGGDADLARAVAGAPPGVLVRYRPTGDSDLARAVGLAPGAGGGVAVALDLLRLADGPAAVNGTVLGVPPDRLRWWHRRSAVAVEVDGRPAFTGRATTVAVLNGQYLGGADLSPRGHPGDGTAEIQIYGLAGAQRAGMRQRLRTGSHVPHPEISLRRGRRVAVHFSRAVPLEVDGRAAGRVEALELQLVPEAYRLLV
jgi:YegS C-terminal NAD kinase beta sandwich-like domain